MLDNKKIDEDWFYRYMNWAFEDVSIDESLDILLELEGTYKKFSISDLEDNGKFFDNLQDFIYYFLNEGRFVGKNGLWESIANILNAIETDERMLAIPLTSGRIFLIEL